jgi:hypothetical protein
MQALKITPVTTNYLDGYQVPGPNGENVKMVYDPTTKTVLQLQLQPACSLGRTVVTGVTATTVGGLYTVAEALALIQSTTVPLTVPTTLQAQYTALQTAAGSS